MYVLRTTQVVRHWLANKQTTDMFLAKITTERTDERTRNKTERINNTSRSRSPAISVWLHVQCSFIFKIVSCILTCSSRELTKRYLISDLPENTWTSSYRFGAIPSNWYRIADDGTRVYFETMNKIVRDKKIK